MKPGQNHHGATIYTCPMHPDVQQERPGKCPKCGMQLVPKNRDGAANEMERAGHDEMGEQRGGMLEMTRDMRRPWLWTNATDSIHRR